MTQAAKPKNPASIQLTAPLLLAAAVGAALPAMFSGVAYSGGKVASHGVVIDLETTEVPAKMPLLFEHGRRDIVGVVEGAENKANQITVAGKLFSDMTGGDAERIAQLSSRGAPYQLSIGLYNYSEEYIPAGQAVTVNGALHQGPIVVLRNGRVRECSVVTLGADANTSVVMFALPDAGTDSQPKPTPKAPVMDKTAEQLAADNLALTAQIATMQAATAKAAADKRTADVAALFKELGEQPTAEQTTSFAAMDEAAFSASAGAMRGMAAKARKLNPALFTDAVTKGADEGKGAEGDGYKPRPINLSLPDILAKRRKAAVEAAAHLA